MPIPTAKVLPGDRVEPRVLAAIDGREVGVPDPTGLVHLQFRRFAGCPFCNLHIGSLVARQAEIEGAGVGEVLVFHSTRDELLAHQRDLPFAVVADPRKALYREFGVEQSWRADLDPRAWLPALRGLRRKPTGMLADKTGGIRGLPADFLIAPHGEVVASYYGRHAYDQWSVDKLLEIVRAL